MKPFVDLVIFDIGKVLLDFSLGKLSANFERLKPGSGKMLIDYMSHPVVLGHESGDVSPEAFFRFLSGELALGVSFDVFKAAFNDIFDPITENIHLLEELSEVTHTALLSNTNPIHWDYFTQAYPVLLSAKWPFSSHHLRSRKPQKEIYQRLLSHAGVNAERALFIDDLSENIDGANRIGLKTILFHGKVNLRNEINNFFNLGTENGIISETD